MMNTEQTPNHRPIGRAKLEVEKLNLFYGDFQALKQISLRIPEKEITAFIGPSGCGKSTPAENPEPDERPGRGVPDRGNRAPGWAGYLRQYGCEHPAPPGGDGVSKAQPLPP